ncbi:MAG TPA: response regulator [Lacunisphaera sp.]|nr:response regulator [Lacunisphaera sp.]
MNPEIQRTLDVLSAHQDYAWFLVLLAWSAVPLAALADRKSRRVPGWLLALALLQMAAAGVELVLLAQDLSAPYVNFDHAMGGITAAGAVVLWLAPAGRPRWQGVVLLVAAGLVVAWRPQQPVLAGGLIGLAVAGGAWRLVRRTGPEWGGAIAGVALAALIVPHGPLAHVVGRGRINTDLSGFALPSTLVLFVAGASAGWQVWRTYAAATAIAPRDFRRLLALLVAWLAVGGGLIVWQGRGARRAFEQSLLQRTVTAAALLDQTALRASLGPDFRVTGTEWRRYADGRPVLVATTPHILADSFEVLRRQLRAIHATNPDFLYLYLAVVRDGYLVAAANSEEVPSGPRQRGRVIAFRPAETADLDRLADRHEYLEGPFTKGAWGAVFSAKAPLVDATTGQCYGWLEADVNATAWTASFTQVRLQGMLLVVAGVALWALGLAYRVRHEERLAAERRAEAAAAADRMKSAFLAKVSHELRTPLQSLLGFGELLARAGLGERERAYVRALRGQTELMLRVVNDLIDLGAMQAGVFRLQPTPTNLPELFEDLVTVLRPTAAARGLQLQVEVSRRLPAWAELDPARVRQVMLNLLGNALKFTPAGEVRLQVGETSGAEAGWLVVDVSDTGPGIPAAQHEQLFQPFAAMASGPHTGAGLGLAMVRALCTAMGGAVELVAAETGAHFRVRLPLVACAAPAPVQPTTPRAWDNLHILVVEDNTLVRELLVTCLVDNGASVQATGDGADALALCERRLPDVVLLDIALPRMSGLAVARELRQRHPAAAVRIIGLSAHAQEVDAAAALAAGMDKFLVKPVGLSQLAAAISDAYPAPAESAAPTKLRARLEDCFEVETPLVLAELRTAVERGDWETARRHAHYLKNSADVLEFTELQQGSLQFSNTPWEQKPEQAHAALAALEQVVRNRPRVRLDRN